MDWKGKTISEILDGINTFLITMEAPVLIIYACNWNIKKWLMIRSAE